MFTQPRDDASDFTNAMTEATALIDEAEASGLTGDDLQAVKDRAKQNLKSYAGQRNQEVRDFRARLLTTERLLVERRARLSIAISSIETVAGMCDEIKTIDPQILQASPEITDVLPDVGILASALGQVDSWLRKSMDSADAMQSEIYKLVEKPR